MKRWPTKALHEVLSQRVEECRITDSSKETFVTVRLYGKGAIPRKIGDGKTPLMKTGYRLRSGDLVYSRIDARNGAFALVPRELNGAVASKDFPSFAILRDRIHPSFLSRFLSAEQFFAQLQASSFGTTNRQRITEELLLSYKIPVPPLAEQERIVKLLDEADELRKLRAQADRRTADLIPALFHDMFGDPATNPKEWPVSALGDLVETVSGGTPSKDRAEFWIGTIPWVSPKDMKQSEILDSEDHLSDQAITETTLKVIPAGSVLVVTRGMILAHTVPIRVNAVPVTINQDMKALLPRSRTRSVFIRWALQARHTGILSHVSSAGHGTKRLETKDLIAIQLPVPPLSLQRDFAARVAEIRAMATQQAAARRRLDALFQSLLHRAFQGEL